MAVNINKTNLDDLTEILLKVALILYSYLMGVQAIYQNIFPRYWERLKCSIARGQRPREIEHVGLSQYRGKNCLIYCLHSH